MALLGKLQFRRDTAAAWAAANPILKDGELGLEQGTGQFKVGNGTSTWNSLPYGGIVGPTGSPGTPGVNGVSITSIARTSGNGAAGTTDTYTITLSNGSTSTFTVTNGSTTATATAIKTTTATVALSQTAPTAGQVLTATSPTAAMWATPAPAGVSSVTVDGISIVNGGTQVNPSLSGTGQFTGAFITDLAGNPADTQDGGLSIPHAAAGVTTFDALFRKASNGKWYLRSNLPTAPNATTSITAGTKGVLVADVEGYAKAGANSDITSLTGLTTDLSVDQGGTGASTPAAARSNLGVYQTFSPADFGLVEANFPVMSASSTGSGALSGVVYASKMRIRTGGSLSSVTFVVGVAGTGLSAGYVVLYDASGNLVAQSAEMSTAFSTTGAKTIPFTAPVTTSIGDVFFVGYMVTASGTVPQLVRGVGSGPLANLNATATLGPTYFNFFTFGTAVTTPPTTITGGSSSGQTIWLGMS